VAGVLPGSPGAAQGVRAGDLVSRINGEAVAGWDPQRYERLVASAGQITFTFINGASESTKAIGVSALVP
jgi:S1-C subfamily serine protease